MTNDEIEKRAERAIAEIHAYFEEGFDSDDREECIESIGRAIRGAVEQTLDEAAGIADRKCQETDEWAANQSLPPDHGGDMTIAEEIRALKDSLDAEVK